MAVLSTILGAILLIVTANDVFQTLLRPSGTGRLSHLVFRAAWSIRGRGGRPLPSLGPLAILTVTVGWVMLSTLGWALIYLPHVPGGFAYTGVDPYRHHPFAEAITISMVALTTLGYGDAVPTVDALRLLSPLEALGGFGLLTASVSWFMQVYPALGRRRTLAIELTALADAGLTRLDNVDDAGASALLAKVTHSLAEVSADLTQNAEIFYFAERDERLSAPHAMRFILVLRDAAASSTSDRVRAHGIALANVIDQLARHISDEYSHVRGDSADEILAAVAGSHGHHFSAMRARDDQGSE
ncbi:two pore domain potassium channel family protein [Labedella populi]|uniref:Two pore domain potassium channel family protein n=1 Tax=Labedella populi TaxID=2498850 RepID=A0A3S3ZNJ4_9MICO|nr:potassium channel family protein [Labedella populi]RWZ59268.1 two pore domain potassium channel family protein [Labedella populi]